MVEIIGLGTNGRVGTALSPDVEPSVKEWGKQIGKAIFSKEG